MLVKEFGAKQPDALAADVNGDAQVSLADLIFLARHLDAAKPAVVPEPISVVHALAALGLFLLARNVKGARTNARRSMPQVLREASHLPPGSA